MIHQAEGRLASAESWEADQLRFLSKRLKKNQGSQEMEGMEEKAVEMAVVDLQNNRHLRFRYMDMDYKTGQSSLPHHE